MSGPDFTQAPDELLHERLHWRTSSYSNGGGECVEVAELPDDGGIVVRDSKLGKRSPILRLSKSGWTALTAAVSDERFGLH